MNKFLAAGETETLLEVLRQRFHQHMERHENISWGDMHAKLLTDPQKLWSLSEMERTGGEPDVVGRDAETGEYLFMDCSPESPAGRRSTCYDQEALLARKEHQPANSAVQMAAGMGIQLLTEKQYRDLQNLGRFDLKTSSWIDTPPEIRSLGGALFCDRRYEQVFTYHNGAQSYYAARGFRGSLRV